MFKSQKVTVNGRSYRWPSRPVVAVCVDGSEPDYIEKAMAAGRMPWTEQVVTGGGVDLRVDCVVPTFTNPNNLSIVTGVPPEKHGICGNFYYDQECDSEIMMNDPALLRVPTIFKLFQNSGARIAIVTAKDKLKPLLGSGLVHGQHGSICFSAEKADEITIEENGLTDIIGRLNMSVPNVYSAELSEFVFAAGVEIMRHERPEIMYLSTTDYIQHKYAPGSQEANDFYAMMDRYWEELDTLGAVIALTADHGMNAKHDVTGSPNVIYLQDMLDNLVGPNKARVILPITDPYVVHHGALGSFATVYLEDGLSDCDVISKLAAISGIEKALINTEGCALFQLPKDRMGDLIVVSERSMVLGTTRERHDFSGLDVPLRSHGGISEQVVPLICSKPVSGLEDTLRLRNFDLFDIVLNHVA